jgi:hypothetical protein
MSITTFWLSFGLYYISHYIGWSQFSSLPLEALGSFLEGAFAPLAFLWLVVGYFLQQKELSKNTAVIQQQHTEMQKSAEHAALQAVSIQASALHSQQQTFMRIYESVSHSLGSVVGMLYISSQGSDGTGEVSTDNVANLWSEMIHGDPEMFSRRFLFINGGGEQDMCDLLFGTDIRKRHSDSFMTQYKRLFDAAIACDPDGMIIDAIRHNAHGRLYQIMLNKCEITDKAGLSLSADSTT